MKANKTTLKTFIRVLTGFITALFLAHAIAASDTPIGYWKAVDDKSGVVLSIIQIYPAGHTLQGRIAKIMPVHGQQSTDRCVNCKGARRNQPNLGMTMIWGMQQVSNNEWARGHVLDPRSGTIYQANMTLVDNGDKLRLRGYIGLPIFGRSTTWDRASKLN